MDKDVLRIVRACPDAYVLPRVNVTLPFRWCEENEEELCDFGFHGLRWPCFASDKWIAEVKRCLALLIEHIEAAPYRDRIVGYQLSTGWTEEWICPDHRGAQGARSREKFAALVKKGEFPDTVPNYYRFLSRTVAERFCELCSFVKEKTQRRLIVGGFYGYVAELTNRGDGHHALETVLNCPDVDFLCSPLCYSFAREVGRDHVNMTALDSLKLHGKLYFSENDTRTHLTKPFCDLPYYQKPVWYGPDKNTAIEALKMHFSRALTHGHAFWWFDMWGGWYADETYMHLLSDMREIAERALSQNLQSCAELAVVLDEDAFAEFEDDAPIPHQTVRNMRHTLGFTATPYDVYLASDLPVVKTRYRAFVLLCPCLTPRLFACIEELKAIDAPYLVISAENADVTPMQLRDFFGECHITPRCDKCAVVYENESYLFLHTTSDEEITLHYDGKLREVFGEEIRFPARPGKGKSFLFEKIK